MRYYTIEHLLRTYDYILACKLHSVIISWKSAPIIAYKEVCEVDNLLVQEDGISQQENKTYLHPVISVNW